MQTLYPIIRRVRRSLVVTEAVADGSLPDGPPKPQVVVGNVEAAQPVETEPKAEAVARIEPAKSSDEKVSTNTDAR